jgi:hypothetical protein
MGQKLTAIVNLDAKESRSEFSVRSFCADYNRFMDPFRVVKQSWTTGDTREVEVSRIDRQIGLEYDSYRRIYLADNHEWIIAGKIARDDGKTYYILECVA